MIEKIKAANREEWLENRKNRIGGSDASILLGINPWKSNVALFEEKIGISEPENLSNNKAVSFGSNAEKHLRELFKLEYEDKYSLQYDDDDDFSMWINSKYPFAHASLDGILTDLETGEKGVLEIKTTKVFNDYELNKWDGNIPDYYYVQCLHYMFVCNFDFAIVKARIKIESSDDVIVRHYKFNRKSCNRDIELLIKKEEEFYQNMLERKSPDLILPEI